MQIRLELENEGRRLLWRAVDRPLFRIGKNPECELCIPDNELAPVHALLELHDTGVRLINRHPQGTQVGEVRVEERAELKNGDCIRLGSLRAWVRIQDDAPHGGTRTLPRDPGSATRLRVSLPEAFPGKGFVLADAGLTVGSAEDNDIRVQDPYVSAHHAQLFVREGRPYVRDAGSRNGIFLEGKEIKEGELPLGARLLVGRTALIVAGDHEATPGEDLLVGGSAPMVQARAQLLRIAGNDAPVLISGETGTGKEVAARLLVEHSRRAGRAFHVLNCGALSQALIASELFGHEKGAFTGASHKKVGAFEASDRGTLFLDEIGELPLELQPQLLRVVEYGEVRRVGAAGSFKVDVRLIAATNRELGTQVEAGSFREDLYHRLSVLNVVLPPLRQRRDDIPLLVRFFLRAFAPDGARLDVDDEALVGLTAHDWPGNVRELKNVVQRAVLMRSGDRLSAADFTVLTSSLASRLEAIGAVSGRTLADIEKNAIIQELVRFAGNKKEAATALGISRATIHRKIEEYGIDPEAPRKPK